MSGSDSSLQLQVWNDMSVLDRNRQEVRAYLERRAVESHAIHRVEVVFDELVTNIIRHGYAGDVQRRIDLNVRVNADHVALLFDDDGREFNPISKALPSPATSLEEARPGGLGLLLLRKLSSGMRYERMGARNRTLVQVGIRKSSDAGAVRSAVPTNRDSTDDTK